MREMVAEQNLMDEGAEEAKAAPTNLERLLGHLEPDSLAARLAGTWMNPGGAEAQATLQALMRDRLEELRRHHAAIPNRED